jgi:hypothetical protein
VPATSSNIDLCRLLISASVLGYGTPILINWAAEENEDEYVQHLAKVGTLLRYLEQLLDHGAKDDLVLIVDGFDIHFQLPPEVLIQRYFQLNDAANQRIEKQVGRVNMTRHSFKQTVVFGHDKLCWPMDAERPACWAVPDATGSPYAFGPYTDKGGDPLTWRARWLNSGTIMGPVGDVRDVFNATLDLINTNHTTDSDQFYFSNIFADQELSRRLFQPDPFGDVEGLDISWPAVEPTKKTEYHIGLDYEGLLFQTMAFFRPSITFMTFDGSPKPPSSPPSEPQKLLSTEVYYDKVLPKDLAKARRPHPAAPEPGIQFIADDSDKSRFPLTASWKDVSLGINAISSNIFPLLHFTGPKWFRELWWDRMWYSQNAEELMIASWQNRRSNIADTLIRGKIWRTADFEQGDVVAVTRDQGGALGDQGAYLPWQELCGEHEPILFKR